MNRKFVTFGIIAGIVWYLSRQAVRIDVGSPSISFLKLAGAGVELNVKLPVLNRSDFNYTVQGFLGQFLFNGDPLGTITLNQPIQIPAHGTSSPEFSTTIGYAAIVGPLSALIQKTLGFPVPGVAPVDPAAKPPSLSMLRVKGTLYVSDLSIDIDEPLG